MESVSDGKDERSGDDALVERLLVIACQAGDEGAFAELVGRYAPRLAYYVRKVLGAAEDPDDVLQEVWTDVFRTIGRLRSPASFRPWLYSIARARAFDEVRRERRAPAHEAGGALEDAAAGPEPDFTEEDAARIHAALDEISPEHREVLVLRFLEDMSGEEIAAAIGCAPGTVRSRLHYAKVALRRALERKERSWRNGTSERSC